MGIVERLAMGFATWLSSCSAWPESTRDESASLLTPSLSTMRLSVLEVRWPLARMTVGDFSSRSPGAGKFSRETSPTQCSHRTTKYFLIFISLGNCWTSRHSVRVFLAVGAHLCRLVHRWLGRTLLLASPVTDLWKSTPPIGVKSLAALVWVAWPLTSLSLVPTSRTILKTHKRCSCLVKSKH